MAENKFDFTAGITIPGETMVAAMLNLAAKTRETMSQENRDRQDALMLRVQEDAYFVWRHFWETVNVLPPEERMPRMIGAPVLAVANG